MPKPSEFDPSDDFHNLLKRITDLSRSDFEIIAKVLAGSNQEVIKQNQIYHLIKETKDVWRTLVKSTADVFIKKETL